MTLKRPGRDVQKFIIIFHVNVSRSRKRSHKSETGREDGQTSGETSPQSKDGKGVADWMARSINPRCNWPKEGWRGTERGVGLIEMYGEQWTTLRRRRPGRAWFHDGGNNGILVTLASTRRFLSGPRDASAPPRLSRSFSLSLSRRSLTRTRKRETARRKRVNTLLIPLPCSTGISSKGHARASVFARPISTPLFTEQSQPSAEPLANRWKITNRPFRLALAVSQTRVLW